MKKYLLLQFKRTLRYFSERGIAPLLGLILLACLIGGLGYLISIRTSHAGIVYLTLQMFALLALGERRKIETLKLIYSKGLFRKLRIVENLIVSVPFMVCLIIFREQYFYVSLVLPVFMGFVLVDGVRFRTIPTPYTKEPVLLPAGFRKTLLINISAYTGLIFSLLIDNYNLGLFALIVMVFIYFSFYNAREPYEYVWIFNLSAKAFIIQKLKEGAFGLILFVAPALIIIIARDWESSYLPLIILLLAVLNLINLIGAKYADFPNEIMIPNGLVVALAMIISPLVIITIPYFYSKAIRNLKPVLE